MLEVHANNSRQYRAHPHAVPGLACTGARASRMKWAKAYLATSDATANSRYGVHLQHAASGEWGSEGGVLGGEKRERDEDNIARRRPWRRCLAPALGPDRRDLRVRVLTKRPLVTNLGEHQYEHSASPAWHERARYKGDTCQV